ncbi:hypothetical protein [Streptomyces rimosus]|uniref:hypothetical protein n=1 Tax=Streptomyces rimosus TaxID=1927 RepID=UPI000AF08976|nr:hypothetical protein [Streptomyces rimosus]
MRVQTAAAFPWADVLLLVAVLMALIVLLASGLSLEEAVAVLGLGLAFTAQPHRRPSA